MSQQAGVMTRSEIDQILPHFAVGPARTVLAVYRDGRLYSVSADQIDLTDFEQLTGPLLRYLVEELAAGR